MRYAFSGLLVYNDELNAPARAVEMVPAIVAAKRNALTAKPLFAGDIVLRSIVMHGDNHDSAKRYSSPRLVIENQKLFWKRQHMQIVGIPKRAEKTHIYALVIRYPFCSYTSLNLPPVSDETSPHNDTTNALATP